MMSIIATQTDIDKLLAENPYLQFLPQAQQAPTSLIDFSSPGWASGSTPEAQAPANYLMTENFPGMDPRTIAEYQKTPDANAAQSLNAGQAPGTSFSSNSIAEALYQGGKFADKDFTSDLKTLSGGDSIITSNEWKGFLDKMNYVEEQQLGQYLKSSGISDTTPFLSYWPSDKTYDYGLGPVSLNANTSPYGTSGKQGLAYAPFLESTGRQQVGPFSPWMDSAEKAKISEDTSLFMALYPSLIGDRKNSLGDTVMQALARVMGYVASTVGPYGAITGPAYAVADAGMQTAASQGSGWDFLKQAVPSAIAAYYGGSAASGALAEGASEATTLLSSLGKSAATGTAQAVLKDILGGSSVASSLLPALLQQSGTKTTESSTETEPTTIAQTLEGGSTGTTAGTGNLLRLLSGTSAAQGGGNINRLLRRVQG